MSIRLPDTLPGAQWQNEDLQLALYVQPRASKDEFVGQHGDEIKVRTCAPPVDGKANIHLQKWLAKCFATPRRQVRILRGEASRHKLFLIEKPVRLPAELLAFGLMPVKDRKTKHLTT